jgi:probable rRNA maturation factor
MNNSNTHISVTLTDDVSIQKLNKKYLKRDFPTDVLSFTYDHKEEDGNEYLGEIFVNKEQAARQAKEYGNTLEEEISELVAHGVLHLLGVHHEDDDGHTVHGVEVCNLS